MTTNSSSSSLLTSLLLPSEYVDDVLHGGAEIIERRVTMPSPSPASTTSTAWSYHLHLFDEEERIELLGREDLPERVREAHRAHLQRLQSAREVILKDSRLSRWLTCRDDPSLWPGPASLSEAGDVVAMLKEIGDTPDSRGASVTRQAVRLLCQEATKPGLYSLNQVQVAGELVAFAGDIAAQNSTKISSSNTNRSEKQQTWRQCQKDIVAGDRMYRLQGAARVYSSPEVLELPLTTKAVEQLVAFVLPATEEGETPKAAWARLIRSHLQHLRDGAILPLMGSIQEVMHAWGIRGDEGESRILEQLQGAREEGRRVRLQVGVYATVLHLRTTVCIVVKAERGRYSLGKAKGVMKCGSGAILLPQELAQQVLQRAMSATDLQMLEHDYLNFSVMDGLLKGMVRVLVLEFAPGSQEMHTPVSDEVLTAGTRKFFLSPLLNDVPWSNCCRCQPLSLSSSSSVWAYRCHAAHNPFVVLHGYRVEGGTGLGHTAFLGRMKRERDERLEAFGEEAELKALGGGRTAAATPVQRGSPAASGLVPCSLVGEELRKAVESAVLRVLSTEPLSKADLMDHRALRAYAGSPNFEPVVKAVLKERAQYRSKRYELKE